MKVRISILDELQPVHVELEHPNAIGVLVGRDEPLAARVELEVPRRHAARVEDADGRQQTRHSAVLFHAEYCNGVMTAIRHQNKAS